MTLASDEIFIPNRSKCLNKRANGLIGAQGSFERIHRTYVPTKFISIHFPAEKDPWRLANERRNAEKDPWRLADGRRNAEKDPWQLADERRNAEKDLFLTKNAFGITNR